MSKKPVIAPETSLSWLAILGFTDPKVADWGEVRAAQKAAFHRYSLTRTTLVISSIWVIFVTYYGSIPSLKLFGWLGAMSRFFCP